MALIETGDILLVEAQDIALVETQDTALLETKDISRLGLELEPVGIPGHVFFFLF